jgi:hypothetical protein
LGPQGFDFLDGELEREVSWKTVPVALESFIQAARINAIETRKICIQDNSMPANPEDQRLEPFGFAPFVHVAFLPGITI